MLAGFARAWHADDTCPIIHGWVAGLETKQLSTQHDMRSWIRWFRLLFGRRRSSARESKCTWLDYISQRFESHVKSPWADETYTVEVETGFSFMRQKIGGREDARTRE